MYSQDYVPYLVLQRAYQDGVLNTAQFGELKVGSHTTPNNYCLCPLLNLFGGAQSPTRFRHWRATNQTSSSTVRSRVRPQSPNASAAGATCPRPAPARPRPQSRRCLSPSPP